MLPVEIQSRIIMHLDLPALLSVRMTRKSLHSLTKLRQVWYNIITQLEKTYKISSLEEEIDDYTTEELEHWALRRSCTQEVWARSKPPHPRTRVVDPYPGGRWFLIGNSFALMYVHDLDAAQPEPRLLFDPNEFDEEEAWDGPTVEYCLWIDESKPRLSFRIAGSVMTGGDARTFIYDVELVGHGASAALVANRRVAFRNSKSGSRDPTFTLNRHYFLEVLGNTSRFQTETDKEIQVYRYSEAPGFPNYPVTRPITYQFSGYTCVLAEFVSENIFIINTSQGSLRVFEVACQPESPQLPHSIQLLHVVPFICHCRSGIRRFPGSSRLVILAFNELKGITTPHNKSVHPIVVELGKLPKAAVSRRGLIPNSLGISASLFFRGRKSPVEIATHSWDLNAQRNLEYAPSSAYIPNLPSGRDPIAYSEDVGRVVFWKEGNRDSLLVVDLV
ncbi:hypothetical protein P691DRAFT_758362 [Macrolepiota fuliginosa MF-IS2]|uniref:F-box domain-containing protein n=1 Tax=Macrolepiota fuliginosa MF-IS2 TaxID=1400762 RepID=A0A9P5XH61_9AGAR|nr:hypothetical protein P691DRAFT_758362 [Macrolepiota fuliginosa MF-IS2]